MNWHLLLIPLFLLALFFFVLATAWYQPEARFTPFTTGQVWKNSAGHTMKVIAVFFNSRGLTLTINKTTLDGEFTLVKYSGADFRYLLIKNRYKLV